MKQQSGFTLIELIAVIVILGILAATAVPRFVNLQASAQSAALRGIAANLSSASSLNYAAYVAQLAGLDNAPASLAVANCTAVANLLEGGVLPTGYVITDAAVTAGASTTCTLTHTASSQTATFAAYGAAALP